MRRIAEAGIILAASAATTGALYYGAYPAIDSLTNDTAASAMACEGQLQDNAVLRTKVVPVECTDYKSDFSHTKTTVARSNYSSDKQSVRIETIYDLPSRSDFGKLTDRKEDRRRHNDLMSSLVFGAIAGGFSFTGYYIRKSVMG